CPVDVDAAAFEYQTGLPAAHAQSVGDDLRDAGVLLPVVVLGPSVEAPVRHGDFSGLVPDEQGARIASPASISRMMKEFDGREVGMALLQDTAHSVVGVGILDQNADTFHAREVAYNLAVEPRNRRELPGPVGFFM